MKKLAVLAMTGLLCMALFSGCGTEEDADSSDISEEQQEISISVEPIEDLAADASADGTDNHEGEAQSDLTGEWIDAELAAQRPVAVMLGNTKIAAPQYGIGSADIIYEAPVEGSETRLMAIFQDYQNVEKIMSIRSCRHYYIDWALEFDAIYAHYGQSYLAEDMLGQSYVNNLSGLEGQLSNTMYFRDSSKSAPHNAYTTGEGIAAGISIKGYDTQHDGDYESHYQFNTDDENEITLTDGEDAVIVQPGYLVNKPWFVYDTETGLYERYQFSSAQTDALTGEQLTVKNILIQVCDWYTANSDTGYLDVETTGSGTGYYVTNGKAIPVTWSKESQTAATRYYDAAGNEITLNQGKTWVCVVQDTYEKNITFYAGEEEFSVQ
ncbi:MAG: DUF3048 domain-containing protein [Lachnospiraceae bacterium]|nr:DUF3048 domain-containing protein [Lachnospiraceae bacterium]